MVRLLTTIRRYVGTSREIKPHIGTVDVRTGAVLAAEDLPIGSTFSEEDTGFDFVYNGETWEPDARTAQTIIIVARLLTPLNSLLEESRTQTGILQGMASDIPEEEA